MVCHRTCIAFLVCPVHISGLPQDIHRISDIHIYPVCISGLPQDMHCISGMSCTQFWSATENTSHFWYVLYAFLACHKTCITFLVCLVCISGLPQDLHRISGMSCTHFWSATGPASHFWYVLYTFLVCHRTCITFLVLSLIHI